MRELDEIEGDAERCNTVAHDVETALRAARLGWLFTGIQSIKRAGPAMLASSFAPIATTATTSESDKDRRRIAETATADASPASLDKDHTPPAAVRPAVGPHRPQANAPPKRATKAPGTEKKKPSLIVTATDDTDAPNTLSKLARSARLGSAKFKLSADVATPTQPSIIEELFKSLSEAAHPVVVAAHEADRILEHARVRVLPMVAVLAERSRDDAVKDSYRKLVRLTNPQDDLANLIWAYIIKQGVKDVVGQGMDPRNLLHLADLATPVLRGIGAACLVLPDLSQALITLVQRVRMSRALDRASAPWPAHDSSQLQPAARTAMLRTTPTQDEVDFAILTVLDVELEAVRRAFLLGKTDRVKRDARVYWRGVVPLPNGESYTVVVAQAVDMANIDTALLVADTVRDWKPSAALLVGIAARAASTAKAKVGDVVIGSEVQYHERGKILSDGVEPEPKMIPADATLLIHAKSIVEWDLSVPVRRPDGFSDAPRVCFGVIASGEKVIADGAARDRIRTSNRKILALEMEGFGFARGIWQSMMQVRHLVIRGISDDADSAKGDDWHEYAAASAAAAARAFLEDRPLPPKVVVAPEPSEQEVLDLLRDQGRLPQLALGCSGRSLDTPERGVLTATMLVTSVGPSVAYQVVAYVEGGPPQGASLAAIMNPSQTASFSVTWPMPPRTGGQVSRQVRLQFTNNFGDVVEEERAVIIDLAAGANAGINAESARRRYLGKRPVT